MELAWPDMGSHSGSRQILLSTSHYIPISPQAPLWAQSGHGRVRRKCLLSGVKRTWRGHWNLLKIEHRREPPEGDMQRRGGSGQPVKGQRVARPKAHKAATTHVSGTNFPAFIDIDDKGNDAFKDLNLG